MGCSDSGKADEKNTSSKPASPVVSGDVVEIKVTGSDVVGADEEERGEGGGMDGIASDANEPKSKRSSDELMDLVARASEGGNRGNVNKRGKTSIDVAHKLHAWTEGERRKKMKSKFDHLHALVPNLPKKADQATIVDATINYIKKLEGDVKKLEMLKKERERAAAATSHGSKSTAAPPPPPAAATDVTLQAPPPSPEEEKEDDGGDDSETDSEEDDYSEERTPPRETTLADLVNVWEAEGAAGGTNLLAPPPAAALVGDDAPPPPPMQTWTGNNMTVSLTGHDAFITMSLPRPRNQNLVAPSVSVLERHQIDVVTATVSTPEDDTTLLSMHCRLRQEGSSSQNLTAMDKYKLAVSELMLWVAV